MRKTIAIAIVLLCATTANAKSLKYDNQDLQKAAPCWAEIEQRAQLAKDMAPFDANGNPRTPTAKYKPHDHSKCDDWDGYVKQKYFPNAN